MYYFFIIKCFFLLYTFGRLIGRWEFHVIDITWALWLKWVLSGLHLWEQNQPLPKVTTEHSAPSLCQPVPCITVACLGIGCHHGISCGLGIGCCQSKFSIQSWNLCWLVRLLPEGHVILYLTRSSLVAASMTMDILRGCAQHAALQDTVLFNPV